MVTAQNIVDALHTLGFDPRFRGDSQVEIHGFSSLFHYRENTMTFVVPERSFADYAAQFFVESIALMILSDKEPMSDIYRAAIYVSDPRLAFFKVIEWLFAPAPSQPTETLIGSGSYLSPEVKLGKCVTIGCCCVLNGDITVGDYTHIGNNAVLENRVTIGTHCEIDACTVIGTDGFNIQYLEDGKKGLNQHYGGVTIGDYVHIGEHTHVNRGMLDDTVIGDYSKIDGLCHVAHNVQIGRGCLIIAGSTLYGSAVLQDNVQFSTAIILNSCTIGKDSMIGAGSVVTRDIPSNKIAYGNPAKPVRNRY